MSIENLKEFISEDKQEAFEAAVTQYVEEQVGGIKSNRDKIKAEKLKLQDKFKLMEQKANDYDKIVDDGILNEYNILKDAEERRKLLGQSGDQKTNVPQDLVDLQMQLKKFETDNKTLLSSLESEKENSKKFSELLINKEKKLALRSAFDAINIDSEYADILVKANLGNTDAKIDESGVTVFMHGEDGEPIGIDDYFKTWSETKQAKKFQKAPVVSGAGASGGDYKGVTSLKDMNLDERTKLYKENPALYNSLKK